MQIETQKHTIAIIGGGRIGAVGEERKSAVRPLTHAGAIRGNPSLSLVGIVEPHAGTRKKIEELFPGVSVYKNTAELYKKEIPKIIVIATPDETHVPLIKEAVAKGITWIVSEKPLATSAADAKKILALQKKSGVRMLVNHSRRFVPAFRRLKEDIDRGRIGEIQGVRAIYGNGIRNNGSHLIDLLRWWLGDVAWVSATARKELPAMHRGDMNVDAMLGFTGGGHATIQAVNTEAYYIFEQEIFGTKGMIAVQDLGYEIKLYGLRTAALYAGWPELDREKPLTYATRTKSFTEFLADHIVEWVEGRAVPYGTIEDAAKVLDVIEAIKKSVNASGKKIIL